jgi:hypothetical protein
VILHTVLCALHADHDPAELGQIMQGLSDLDIEGFLWFAHGVNIDAEAKTPDYGYGFVCSFADRAALDRYAADPGHRALGGRLVALCRDGAKGILVSDIQTPQ